MVPPIASRDSRASELVMRANKAAVYILTMSFKGLMLGLLKVAVHYSHLLCPVWQKSRSV